MSELGKSLLNAIDDALEEGGCGIVLTPSPDVAALRKRLKLSQRQFADTYGINLVTLQKWEQGKRVPDSVSKNYLACIAKAPDTMRDLLQG